MTVNVLVKTETLLSLLGPVPTAAQLRDTLRMRLCGAWSDRWWKAPSSGGGGHQKVKRACLATSVNLPGSPAIP